MANIKGLFDDKPETPNDKKNATSYAGGKSSGLSLEQPVNEDAVHQGAVPDNTRMLTMYSNGFEFGGQFFEDDEEGKRLLKEIMEGKAPMEVFGKFPKIQTGEELVGVEMRTSEAYDGSAPQKEQNSKAEPALFEGSGHSLQSGPTPDITVEASDVHIDHNSPKTVIRVRFLNGKTLTQEFNTTASLTEVYNWAASTTSMETHAFSLFAGFPPKKVGNTCETLESSNLLNATFTQRAQ